MPVSTSCDFAEIREVTNVNFKPHPFMVGPKHVAHASAHHGGMLGLETLRAICCAHPGCQVPYGEHTSDKVAFVHLKRDCTATEMQTFLKSLVDDGFDKETGCDGFAFVGNGFAIGGN